MARLARKAGAARPEVPEARAGGPGDARQEKYYVIVKEQSPRPLSRERGQL
jgi:hypothetical protein